MAKGIANGFPMAAVVTTPEIAQVMSQAIHFNTFGGNPMSCAVASTVLEVGYGLIKIVDFSFHLSSINLYDVYDLGNVKLIKITINVLY